MKTLILNGSPRPAGDTAALLAALKEALTGPFVQIDAYREKIIPCLDCRACRTGDCPIPDRMREIGRLAEESGAVLIASPVYFSSLTPPLAAIGSRLQSRYYASLRGEDAGVEKRGAVLLAAGGNGAPEGAYRMARQFLRLWGVKGEIPLAGAWETDRTPAALDREALRQAGRLAAFLEGR